MRTDTHKSEKEKIKSRPINHLVKMRAAKNDSKVSILNN